MERVPTGIPGLDQLIEGGFPRPSSILVTGPTGSAKSIFGLQFLYNGAKEHDEPGFMINIESYPTDVQWYAESFGFDIASLQKKGKLVFSSYDPVEFEKFELRTLHSEIIVQLGKIIDQVGAKRIVIDPVTPLGQSVANKTRFRTLLYYISKALKEKGCTTLFITEKPEESLTEFNVEPYVMDGVIELNLTPREEVLNQTLLIRKMKATKFPIAKYLMDISKDGIRLATGY